MSTKKANLILTTCSMAWGTSYIFMKLGIEGLSPLMLMALRTGIAFLILVLIFFKRLLKVNKRLLLYSAITGFLLFTNLTPILYGLNTITASQSGFILSTTVVLVPVIHAVISRRLPEHHVRLGIIIVLIGMVLINGGDIFAVKPGTLLCMLSAFSYSINIVLNSYFTRQVDPLALLVIAPCTGSTLARLAAGLSDTPVTLAAKSLLRVGRPVVIAVSTNDGLGASGENIARLYQRKHYYFVPYGQDDPQAKPQSLKARFALLPAALDAALEGRQLQPVLCPAAGHGMSFQQGKSVVY